MTEIREMPVPKGCAARPGYPMTPCFITIHNTANGSLHAGAENHGRYLQRLGAQKTVSWHYAVDDRLITHSIPDNEVAWHAGDGAKGRGNRQSLAIEICENPDSNLKKATENAAELAAKLMKQYKIPISHVVQHHHWTGKNCPRQLRAGNPYSWGTFLERVQWYVQGKEIAAPPQEQKFLYTVQTGAFSKQQTAQNYAKLLRNRGIPAIVVRKNMAAGG